MYRALIALALVGATMCGCSSRAGRSARTETKTSSKSADAERRSWLFVSPHPDDAVLVAGGVIARAVEDGEPVAIVVLTNGDYDCVADGIVRERENVTGLGELGVSASQIYFLGYPDDALSALGSAPLSRRRIDAGRCVAGSATYGAFGFGGADFHRARTGSSASYTRANVVADLAALLDRVKPTDVVVTHPSDVHPDHAAAYVLFREALDRVQDAPRVHRAIVHDGDCWPTGPEPGEPCPPALLETEEPMPLLTGRLQGYSPRERIPVPADLTIENPDLNPKVRAIAAHVTQTRGTYGSYLFAFARSDEPFFPERFEKIGGHWLRSGTATLDSMIATTLNLRRAERHETAMSAPLALALRLGKGRTRIDFLEDAAGDYSLEIDDARREARWLRHDRGAAEPVLLATWPLPDDLFATGEEKCGLRFDLRPADGGVGELSFSLRDELWGVGLDVHPRTRGRALSVTAPSVKGDDTVEARLWSAPAR